MFSWFLNSLKCEFLTNTRWFELILTWNNRVSFLSMITLQCKVRLKPFYSKCSILGHETSIFQQKITIKVYKTFKEDWLNRSFFWILPLALTPANSIEVMEALIYHKESTLHNEWLLTTMFLPCHRKYAMGFSCISKRCFRTLEMRANLHILWRIGWKQQSSHGERKYDGWLFFLTRFLLTVIFNLLRRTPTQNMNWKPLMDPYFSLLKLVT